jgi:hypothetical protein
MKPEGFQLQIQQEDLDKESVFSNEKTGSDNRFRNLGAFTKFIRHGK